MLARLRAAVTCRAIGFNRMLKLETRAKPAVPSLGPMAPTPYAQVVSTMCRDHVALADFYTAAFGFARVPQVESPIFIALAAGGVALGFHADEAFDLLEVGERRGGLTANHVTFDLGTAEAVEASVEAFAALGATVVKGPFTTYYDARQVVYLDPEGNVFRVSDTQAPLASWLDATAP
jgi:catechol 2,3-dioxygenase-like lactoylglutathione lyase family enzyme